MEIPLILACLLAWQREPQQGQSVSSAIKLSCASECIAHGHRGVHLEVNALSEPSVGKPLWEEQRPASRDVVLVLWRSIFVGRGACRWAMARNHPLVLFQDRGAIFAEPMLRRDQNNALSRFQALCLFLLSLLARLLYCSHFVLSQTQHTCTGRVNCQHT